MFKHLQTKWKRILRRVYMQVLEGMRSEKHLSLDNEQLTKFNYVVDMVLFDMESWFWLILFRNSWNDVDVFQPYQLVI